MPEKLEPGQPIGILAGGVGTIVWEIVLKSPYGVKSAILMVPFSFAVIYVVSALTRGTGAVPLEAVYHSASAGK